MEKRWEDDERHLKGGSVLGKEGQNGVFHFRETIHDLVSVGAEIKADPLARDRHYT